MMVIIPILAVYSVEKTNKKRYSKNMMNCHLINFLYFLSNLKPDDTIILLSSRFFSRRGLFQTFFNLLCLIGFVRKVIYYNFANVEIILIGIVKWLEKFKRVFISILTNYFIKKKCRQQVQRIVKFSTVWLQFFVFIRKFPQIVLEFFIYGSTSFQICGVLTLQKFSSFQKYSCRLLHLTSTSEKNYKWHLKTMHVLQKYRKVIIQLDYIIFQ